jgi:hypothetical protein
MHRVELFLSLCIPLVDVKFKPADEIISSLVHFNGNKLRSGSKAFGREVFAHEFRLYETMEPLAIILPLRTDACICEFQEFADTGRYCGTVNGKGGGDCERIERRHFERLKQLPLSPVIRLQLVRV